MLTWCAHHHDIGTSPGEESLSALAYVLITESFHEIPFDGFAPRRNAAFSW